MCCKEAHETSCWQSTGGFLGYQVCLSSEPGHFCYLLSIPKSLACSTHNEENQLIDLCKSSYLPGQTNCCQQDVNTVVISDKGTPVVNSMPLRSRPLQLLYVMCLLLLVGVSFYQWVYWYANTNCGGYALVWVMVVGLFHHETSDAQEWMDVLTGTCSIVSQPQCEVSDTTVFGTLSYSNRWSIPTESMVFPDPLGRDSDGRRTFMSHVVAVHKSHTVKSCLSM